MTQDAFGRLRSRLEYPSDGRPQAVTSIETIVRKDDLRTLLTALDGDGVRDTIAAIIWDHLRPVEDTSPVADAILNAIIGEKPGD